MQKIILGMIFLCSLSFAQDSSSTTNNGYIDIAHTAISEKTETISVAIDDYIANKMDFFLSQPKEDNATEPDKVDALFQSEKFTNETRKSFLKFSTNLQYNSLDANNFTETVSANLALNRSNQRLKLFVNNLNYDNINDTTKQNDSTSNDTEVGLSVMQNIDKYITSKYSFGTRGFYPFTRARFSYKKEIKNWLVEPVQSFEYSTKDHFREYTILYFDKSLTDKVLFRVEFQRGTSAKISGMDYDSVLHLFWTPSSKEGWQISQGFYGNTKYLYTPSDGVSPSRVFAGINNYITQLTYRKNVLRPWFFVELSPGVNFSKAHDFKANYRIFAKFDIIFGKI
ncbi:MAG: hypothetical protein R3331_09460 [Sulfurospirillaceae bacterium]|nr:hypothetical protein [Sulfurospirillaceae bacterium]